MLPSPAMGRQDSCCGAPPGPWVCLGGQSRSSISDRVSGRQRMADSGGSAFRVWSGATWTAVCGRPGSCVGVAERVCDLDCTRSGRCQSMGTGQRPGATLGGVLGSLAAEGALETAGPAGLVESFSWLAGVLGPFTCMLLRSRAGLAGQPSRLLFLTAGGPHYPLEAWRFASTPALA